jgi:sec-independent protein translocase protein TatA
MPTIGPMELIVVMVLALIILGPKRLPEMGRSLGRGMREFRDGIATRSDPPAAESGQLGPAEAPAPTPTRTESQ